VLCAPEINAWRATKPTSIAAAVMASSGEAMVLWRSVEISTRGRGMTFGPCGAATLVSAAAGSLG
jgi:hypothetical protein